MNVRVQNSSDERFKEPPFHLENEPSTVGNGLFWGLGFGVHGIYYAVTFLCMFKILSNKKLTKMSLSKTKQAFHKCFQIP